ncbi:Glycogen synthase 1 [Hartmannibacter diazotrophicus]|uniref:Glycogen synthase n=1 Tax=Hartmannibacter diazotrophicus TaxID=1482074 RepID=A0A2C9D7K6_9HYPH|nr:glycogen synthase GlgA [Hartmannibacter diazotrophicus]SON56302.1 Glycogen synthase 1 [Hartmannibacter diazotrophicus]
MRILFVASECYPLIKTGGLADVVGALPLALKKLGCDVRVLLPGYPAVLAALPKAKPAKNWSDLFGGSARLLTGTSRDGLEVLAIDAPHLYDRIGNPYLGPDGRDWPDNARRFAALAKVGAEVGIAGANGWVPDVVHSHDWQAGLTSAYIAASEGPVPATMFTIHNIAFQGLCSLSLENGFGLPRSFFTPAGLEFYGQTSFLKAGLVFSDHLTTVSPTYARELRTPEFGMGMEGVLNERATATSGILNGIDLDIWNPETDAELAQTYSQARLGSRSANKKKVQQAFGLATDSSALLFCVISRLTYQKGLDLLVPHLGEIVHRGGQVALLGSGEAGLERVFTDAARQFPGRIGVSIGYDEGLSHLMQGGSDAILVPSRFEPCGLTQLYGLRYGTIPVVARTGGLADTVIDANDAAIRTGVATGVQFSPVTAPGLWFGIERAFQLFSDRKVWRKLQKRAMLHPVGWDESAATYVELYRSLAGEGVE